MFLDRTQINDPRGTCLEREVRGKGNSRFSLRREQWGRSLSRYRPGNMQALEVKCTPPEDCEILRKVIIVTGGVVKGKVLFCCTLEKIKL